MRVETMSDAAFFQISAYYALCERTGVGPLRLSFYAREDPGPQNWNKQADQPVFSTTATKNGKGSP